MNMREVVPACSCIVMVMRRQILVSIVAQETPLIVVVGRFVLTMPVLFAVIMVSVVADGRPFAELFVMSRVRGRLNRAVA
jgi:hypothetical protein